MLDIHWDPDPIKTRTVLMNEDAAGNKWYAEFELGNTTPVRTWMEPPSPAEYVVVTYSNQHPYTLLDA
jgi:hypothetical protein